MQRRSRAFSLVEVLIAVTIIAILLAVLSPAMAKAKRAGLEAVDMSNLQQISLAMQLYEENQGMDSLGTVPLVNAGYIPREVVSSALDPMRWGLANTIADELIARSGEPGSLLYLKRPYRCSYLGFWDYGWNQVKFDREVRPHDSPGYLVFFGTCTFQKGDTHFMPVHGQYLRLLISGSVVKRQFDSVAAGSLGRVRRVSWLFADYTDDEKWQDIKGL